MHQNINFRCLLLLPCLLIFMWASYHSSHKTSGRNVIIQALTDTPGCSSEYILACAYTASLHLALLLLFTLEVFISPVPFFACSCVLPTHQFIWCQHVSLLGFLARAILFHFAATVFSGLVTFQRHLPSLVYGSTFNKMRYLGLCKVKLSLD